MKVKANLNLSMNRDGDKLGIDPTIYNCGEVYDISEELYEDNREHFTQLGLEPEEPADEQSARRDLVKEHSRDELDVMAEKLGLDPQDYNNKTQIAEAIVEAQANEE